VPVVGAPVPIISTCGILKLMKTNSETIRQMSCASPSPRRPQIMQANRHRKPLPGLSSASQWKIGATQVTAMLREPFR
jgi:hypothetical protein